MTLTCKTYQVMTIPKPLPEPLLFGRSVTVRCDGSHCPNPTAPVLISLGTAGAFWLCAHCHAGRLRLIRAMLPVLKRRAL